MFPIIILVQFLFVCLRPFFNLASSFRSARFVILHGTDTMAYTASALSFMFENLGKCVIVTGAQVLKEYHFDYTVYHVQAAWQCLFGMVWLSKHLSNVCLAWYGSANILVMSAWHGMAQQTPWQCLLAVVLISKHLSNVCWLWC